MKTNKLGMMLLPSLLVATSAAHGEENNIAADPVELSTVQVVGQGVGGEGTAENAYRHRNADLGPLGERAVLDTPFSVNAVSSELLRNQGAETYSQAVKFLPSANVEGHFGLEIGPPVLRGFQGDDVAGSVRIDGLNVRADVPLPVELYEKLEVLSGPTAALYGPAPTAGTINSVLKRPTDTPLREVGIGYAAKGNALARADVAGRAGDSDRFGYRFNVLQADGEGYADGSNLRRNLAGVALDYRITNATLVEAFASHYDFNQKGYPGGFGYTNASGLPSAPDPAKAGYGQKFGGVDSTVDLAELHLLQSFDSGWRLSGALMKQVATRLFNNTISNTFTDANGSYKTTYRQSGSRAEVLSDYLYLNGRIASGAVTHDLALGTVGYRIDNFSIPGLRTGSALTLGNASLSDPISYADPGWGGTGTRYHSNRTDVQSLLLSDNLGFGERWSALLATNDSRISVHNWNASGVSTSTYDANSAWSYSGSLIYKPLSTASVYLTYAGSVQPGDIAPSTANNAYESLAPYRSNEWELGVKGASPEIDWSAALFRIRRPFAFTDTDNVFKAEGVQENRGLEVTARGNVRNGLVLSGNITGLDPRMVDTASAVSQDKLVVGVPRLQANIMTEYRIPAWLDAVLEGNVHHIGRRAANAENTLWAAAYTTLDLGVRHEFRSGSKRFTTRLMVGNITDKHYWSSLYTGGGWSGGIATSGTAFLGEPRTVKLSVTVAL
jgi:iron complex outermembrane receptor protein